MNIHHGTDADGRGCLELLRAGIAALDPDVLFLQEVDRGVARSGFVDQLLGLRATEGAVPIYGQTLTIGTGSYGIGGLISPILYREHEFHLYSERPARAEPRGFLLVHLTNGLTLASTHLSQNVEPALVEWQELLARAKPAVVFAGDFNLTLRQISLPERLRSAFGHRVEPKTWPLPAPTSDLDHILIDSLRIRCTRAETALLDCSDHAAVVVDLEER